MAGLISQTGRQSAVQEELLRLVQRSQAAATHVEPHAAPIKEQRPLVGVELPASIGPPFGVTHIMAILRCSPADITFAGHRYTPLFENSRTNRHYTTLQRS
jgi:hypothetical protein